MNYNSTEGEMQEWIDRFQVEDRGKFALTLMFAASGGALAVLILQAIWRSI